MNGLARPTRHAAERYCARVNEDLGLKDARREIERILATGRRMGFGRGKWGKYLQLRPGCVIVEDSQDPSTAVIEGFGRALTCVVEAMYVDAEDVRHG